MENQDNIQNSWRTREQKEELILQWQQSGKSRKVFCQEHGLTYNSLVSWYKQRKDKQASSGFTEVKVKKDSELIAQLQLPGGIKIDFFQSVPAEYFRSPRYAGFLYKLTIEKDIAPKDFKILCLTRTFVPVKFIHFYNRFASFRPI
jgi:hypothetical protein